MSKYDTKYIMCPFYMGQEKKKIRCEGIADGTSVYVAFADGVKKEEYIKQYCNSISRCCECPLHQAAARKY